MWPHVSRSASLLFPLCTSRPPFMARASYSKTLEDQTEDSSKQASWREKPCGKVKLDLWWTLSWFSCRTWQFWREEWQSLSLSPLHLALKEVRLDLLGSLCNTCNCSSDRYGGYWLCLRCCWVLPSRCVFCTMLSWSKSPLWSSGCSSSPCPKAYPAFCVLSVNLSSPQLRSRLAGFVCTPP